MLRELVCLKILLKAKPVAELNEPQPKSWSSRNAMTLLNLLFGTKFIVAFYIFWFYKFSSIKLVIFV